MNGQSDRDIQGSHPHHAATLSSCSLTTNEEVHEDIFVDNDVKKMLASTYMYHKASFLKSIDLIPQQQIELRSWRKNRGSEYRKIGRSGQP